MINVTVTVNFLGTISVLTRANSLKTRFCATKSRMAAIFTAPLYRGVAYTRLGPCTGPKFNSGPAGKYDLRPRPGLGPQQFCRHGPGAARPANGIMKPAIAIMWS